MQDCARTTWSVSKSRPRSYTTPRPVVRAPRHRGGAGRGVCINTIKSPAARVRSVLDTTTGGLAGSLNERYARYGWEEALRSKA